MSYRNKTTLLLSSMLLLGGVAFAIQATERALKDKDLKKFSSELGEYFEARKENKGVLEAEAAVLEQRENLRKKLRTKGSPDLMAHPADLGAALWMSQGYAKKKYKKGKVTTFKYAERFYSKKNVLEYVVALPRDYKPQEAWPLIICIPPADQTPTEHLAEDWALAEFRDGAILAVPGMPTDIETWMDRDGTAAVLITMQQVLESSAVDPNRIFLAGTGKGLEVAMALAGRRGFTYAGVIGRRGDVGEVSPDGYCNLPTYFAGGGAQSTAFEAKIKELGFDNCTLESTGEPKDIWAWMQEHPRVSYPTKIHFWPDDQLTRLNWIEVPRGSAEEGAEVKASIDAGSNTITVDGSGVGSVTIYLSDAMVDLDRPLHIVGNGAVKEVQVARSPRMFMEEAYRSRLDPGQVYVAVELVDLPSKASEADDAGESGDKEK
ncbi:MAG: hypothetical protein ACI87O_000451 [Planctomycetota bacterium]|jgi:hypothetical protein